MFKKTGYAFFALSLFSQVYTMDSKGDSAARDEYTWSDCLRNFGEGVVRGGMFHAATLGASAIVDSVRGGRLSHNEVASMMCSSGFSRANFPRDEMVNYVGHLVCVDMVSLAGLAMYYAGELARKRRAKVD